MSAEIQLVKGNGIAQRDALPLGTMQSIRSQELRHQLLKIIDGQSQLGHFVFNLNNMIHAPRICQWLIMRGLTGANLVGWLKEKHSDSFLEAMKFIVADINKAPIRSIKVGRDYLVKK